MRDETVTHISRTVTGEKDRYGKDIYISTSSDISIKAFAPVVMGEVNGVSQVISTDGGTLYLLPGVTVNTDDQFVVRGITYEVDGSAAEWQSPFSNWYPGDVIILTRSEHVNR